jgi:hypothetical protein
MFGVMQQLNVVVCKDAESAVAAGFDYKNKNIDPVEIKHVVVVQDGTQDGHPTVDFVLKDRDGNEYVVMVTGRLLKALPLQVPGDRVEVDAQLLADCNKLVTTLTKNAAHCFDVDFATLNTTAIKLAELTKPV